MISERNGGDGSGKDASHYVQTELFSEYYNNSRFVECRIYEQGAHTNKRGCALRGQQAEV